MFIYLFIYYCVSLSISFFFLVVWWCSMHVIVHVHVHMVQELITAKCNWLVTFSINHLLKMAKLLVIGQRK